MFPAFVCFCCDLRVDACVVEGAYDSDAVVGLSDDADVDVVEVSEYVAGLECVDVFGNWGFPLAVCVDMVEVDHRLRSSARTSSMRAHWHTSRCGCQSFWSHTFT